MIGSSNHFDFDLICFNFLMYFLHAIFAQVHQLKMGNTAQVSTRTNGYDQVHQNDEFGINEWRKEQSSLFKRSVDGYTNNSSEMIAPPPPYASARALEKMGYIKKTKKINSSLVRNK